ncbi:alpha-ketoglutarate-dependent dioxygenase AlkB [Devosia submarina]|uniref:alpha-ketoglutarate-dependent dioxygenase AlkB n=1 Tax=Devosia submarina TaxID=1173082 RepID=UPI000D3454CD|nr:alpha-ketoglutarate-dependent dioxygenase AlkB [Devosia submarina]
MTFQPDLFAAPEPSLPEGFRYSREIIPPAMQDELLSKIRQLPFRAFDFHGFEGKRRVVSFGWRYDFSKESLVPAEPMPSFLLPVRELAAAFAGIATEQLQQALVTEYGPEAPIGWHKDKSVFGTIVGVSLLSACNFRLRRKLAGKWERVSVKAEPGSVYVLSGPARHEWEHSIPPVEQLRFSITFRQLHGDAQSFSRNS